jgi:hypothetical protein
LLAVLDRVRLGTWSNVEAFLDWINPDGKRDRTDLYSGYEAPVVHAGSRVLGNYRWRFMNFMEPSRPLQRTGKSSQECACW